MSSTGTGVSRAARQRIGRFSAGVWALGGIVMVVVTIVSLGSMRYDLDTGQLFNLGAPNRYTPYRIANIERATYDDETATWRGGGNAVIVLEDTSADDPPLRVSYDNGAEASLYVSTALEPQSDLPPDDRVSARFMGIIFDDRAWDGLVFLGDGVTELWISSPGAWSLSIEALEVEEITDTISGSTDTWFVYRGDSLSARVSRMGEGLFGLIAYTPEDGRDSLLFESGDYNGRVSWPDTDMIVFHLQAFDDRAGVWEFTIDGAMTPAPTDPASGDDPAPDGPADEADPDDAPPAADPTDPTTD